jgi:hypothetical protein
MKRQLFPIGFTNMMNLQTLIHACLGIITSITISFVISGVANNYHVVVPLFLAYVFIQSISVFFVTTAFAAVSFGASLTVLERIGLTPTALYVQLIFIGILFISVLSARIFLSIQPQALLTEVSSTILISISGLLIIRWPLATKLQQLAFLSYEDNAAWISTASQFSVNHSKGYVSGYGGYVLDPLMYLLYVLEKNIEGTTSSLLAYTTVTTSYALLQFVAISTAGLFVLVGASKKERSPTSAFVAALSCVGISYVALQLPRSTGHLTFIGAVCFIWLLLLSSKLFFRSILVQGVISVALIIGIVGMWWPYLAVVAIMILFYLYLNLENLGRLLRGRSNLTRKYIVLFPIVILSGFILFPIVKDSFTSLSIREFLTISGGVQGVPGNLLVFGVVGLAVYSSTTRGDLQDQNGTLPVFSLGILVVILYFSSAFTGPEFTPKYTAQKTLLLFAVVTIPILVLVIADLVGSYHGTNATTWVLTGLLLFGIGNTTTGWGGISSSVQQPVPRWAQALQTQSEKAPNSYILCTTSDPALNLESYICSRHAAALQSKEDDISGDWRFLQLYPGIDVPGNVERAQRLQSNITRKLNLNEKVSLLSFDGTLTLADEDKWWMSSLNLAQFEIVK